MGSDAIGSIPISRPLRSMAPTCRRAISGSCRRALLLDPANAGSSVCTTPGVGSGPGFTGRLRDHPPLPQAGDGVLSVLPLALGRLRDFGELLRGRLTVAHVLESPTREVGDEDRPGHEPLRGRELVERLAQ